MSKVQTVGDKEIIIDRIFNAPLDLVWSVWSDPGHLKNWWGPSGFTNTFKEFEFRAGGNWRSSVSWLLLKWRWASPPGKTASLPRPVGPLSNGVD